MIFLLILTIIPLGYWQGENKRIKFEMKAFIYIIGSENPVKSAFEKETPKKNEERGRKNASVVQKAPV